MARSCSGSAGGKSVSAIPNTTDEYKKIRNWALQFENDKPVLVKYLLEN